MIEPGPPSSQIPLCAPYTPLGSVHVSSQNIGGGAGGTGGDGGGGVGGGSGIGGGGNGGGGGALTHQTLTVSIAKSPVYEVPRR